MNTLQTEAVINLGWEDAQFYGFAWQNGGKDLKLFFTHASQPITEILCHWASDLHIDLKWERLQISTEESPVRRGGPLLVYKVRFTAIKENQLELLLDFAHHGKISFECEKLTAVTNGEIN